MNRRSVRTSVVGIVALVGGLLSVLPASPAGAAGTASAAPATAPAVVPQVPPPSCHGLVATIVVSQPNKVTVGTTGDDVIVGSSGKDRIYGNGGTDTVCGGEGNDSIVGSRQRDWIEGGGGNDTIKGNKGPDALFGGLGTNKLDGGGGQDLCDVGQAGTTTSCELVPGSIVIHEATSPPGGTGFAFTGSLGGFSLSDAANATASGLAPGAYTITQASGTGPAPGWPLTALACTDPSGGTTKNLGARKVTIGLAANETVTCTFTNTAPVGAPQADLSITKTDGVTSVTAGGSTTYTITASNAGPDGVTGATVADTFPASLTATWTCVGAGGGTCPASGLGNINTGVNLPAGGSVTFTASANLSASAVGTLSNTATVSVPGGTTDPTPGNNSATDTDTIVSSADLSITKTDGVTSVAAGGSTTYTITASNAGLSTVSGATVVDTFPATLTATWTCVGAGGGTCPASGLGNINTGVNLPAGGSVTFTVSATISPSATGTLSNTATVSVPAGTTDPTPGNNSGTDTDTVTGGAPSADLSITKTDGVTSVTAGGSTTYTITASNAGPDGVTGATVADTFPATLTATWTCAGAGGGTCPASGLGNINTGVNLPAGGSVTFTASATISPSATGSVSNTATVSAPAGTTDPTPIDNSATDTDSTLANLFITKTDGRTVVAPGLPITYTITAFNAGPSSVTGASVVDTFPADLAGNGWVCIGGGGATCADASGTGDINTTVDLPAGRSATFIVQSVVTASGPGSVSNTATVSAPAGTTDPNPGDNSSTDTDTVAGPTDLSITKTDGVTSVAAGGSTTYTITASNAGPDVVVGGSVRDLFPAALSGVSWTCVGVGGGTCPASGTGDINRSVNLPVGASVTFTASATISAAATGNLVNTATISTPGAQIDLNPSNNSATDTDSTLANLFITKTDGRTVVAPGLPITYTITAFNAGPSSVTGASVVDTFPADLAGNGWVCIGGGGATCADASGTGDINTTVDLPAGRSATFIVQSVVTASGPGSVSNTATVSAPAGTTDPNPGDNSSTDTDTVAGPTDLSITKTDGVTSVAAGGSTTYTITASNAGPDVVVGGSVRDLFPAALSGVSWTCVGVGGGTCPASGTGDINRSVNLPVGASVTFTASATISAAATGNLVNTATISTPGAQIDLNPSNNSATDTDTVTGASSADLSITKSNSVSAVPTGGSTTYTVRATNAGPSSVTGAELTDAAASGLTKTLVACSVAPGNTCTSNPSISDLENGLTLPTLAPGASYEITVTAAVTATAGTNVTNTATIVAPVGTTDPTPGNNSATDTDDALDPANAGPDGHAVTGNVSITVAASGVLGNDTGTTIAIESYGASTGAEQTTIGNATATAQGGSVNLQASGAYAYTPPANFTGTDSFKYVIDNALNLPSTGTVTLAVSDRIMVASSGGAGNCRPASPCALGTAGAAAAVSSGNDLLFVESGAYPSAALTLKAGQTVAGQGVSLVQALVDAGITLAPDSAVLPPLAAGAQPTLSNAGSILTVGGANRIEQLALQNSAGSAISSTGITTGVTILAVQITATSAADGLTISGNSTGSTFTFSDLAITTATGNALSAVGPGPGATTGGTIKSAGGVNTVASSGGIAVQIVNTTIGSPGVSFQSIDANGGTSGIVLNNTGVTAGLGVTGIGATAGSGGSVQNMSDSGIVGTLTANLRLFRMFIGNNGDAVNEGGVRLTNLRGTTNRIESTTVTGSSEDNIYVRNDSGNLGAFTMQSDTITNNSSTIGNDGVNIQAAGNATAAVGIFGGTFQGNRTDAIHLDAADSSLMNAQIVATTILGGSPNQGNVGIEVTSASSADIDALVSTNSVGTNGAATPTLAPLANSGINVFAGGSSSIIARVNSNKVHNAGTGVSGYGIRAFLSTNATMAARIDGNTVDNVGLDYGILAESSGGAGGSGQTMDVGVTNNNVSVLAGALDAIRVQARNTNSVCARVATNTTNAGGTGFFGIYLRQANTATFLLEGLSGPVDPYVAAQNPATASNSSTGTITTAVSCNVPT